MNVLPRDIIIDIFAMIYLRKDALNLALTCKLMYELYQKAEERYLIQSEIPNLKSLNVWRNFFNVREVMRRARQDRSMNDEVDNDIITAIKKHIKDAYSHRMNDIKFIDCGSILIFKLPDLLSTYMVEMLASFKKCKYLDLGGAHFLRMYQKESQNMIVEILKLKHIKIVNMIHSLPFSDSFLCFEFSSDDKISVDFLLTLSIHDIKRLIWIPGRHIKNFRNSQMSKMFPQDTKDAIIETHERFYHVNGNYLGSKHDYYYQ